MSADLADSQKVDEEASKAHHATLVVAKKNEVEILTGVAPSENWLREDWRKVYALLFHGTRLGALQHGVLLAPWVGAARPETGKGHFREGVARQADTNRVDVGW